MIPGYSFKSIVAKAVSRRIPILAIEKGFDRSRCSGPEREVDEPSAKKTIAAYLTKSFHVLIILMSFSIFCKICYYLIISITRFKYAEIPFIIHQRRPICTTHYSSYVLENTEYTCLLFFCTLRTHHHIHQEATSLRYLPALPSG